MVEANKVHKNSNTPNKHHPLFQVLLSEEVLNDKGIHQELVESARVGLVYQSWSQ